MTKKEIDTKLEIAEILVKHLNCETSEALTPIYEYLQKQLLIQRVSNCYQLTSKELAKVKEYGTNVVKMMGTGIGTSVSTLNDKNEWVDITDYDSW